MSNHDRYRANQARAAAGGPDYRASDTGKGDVNRTRGPALLRYELGLQLIEIAEEYGSESPEYSAKLEEWRNAQG